MQKIITETAANEEQEMKISYELIERNAQQLIIENEDDYTRAGELLRDVKTSINEAKAFFAPLKEAAHKAHAAICEREKTMLAPLQKAESAGKSAMSVYLQKKREEARRQEELMRKLAQEEADRKLAEAVKQEAKGDTEAAEMAMAEASTAERVSMNASVVAEAPKTAGISTTKDFEIVSIDDHKVPISASGVVIRPVDQKAILRLIKATKGEVTIPGVQFRETVRMSVSGRRF